jgi:hypothetical protein
MKRKIVLLFLLLVVSAIPTALFIIGISLILRFIIESLAIFKLGGITTN